ncbi:aminopeptidase O [Aplochiton taeniatus]
MDVDLDPSSDDLPLRANTNHILIRHYVLDLTVHLDRRAIRGTVVLFFEPGPGAMDETGEGDGKAIRSGAALRGGDETECTSKAAACGEKGPLGGPESRADVAGWRGLLDTDTSWENTGNGDFTLVLDCCDLRVLQVEEVDILSVPGMLNLAEEVGDKGPAVRSTSQSAALVQRLVSLPSEQWRQQHRLFSKCSRAPGTKGGGTLRFHTDCWSLQVRKWGARTPWEFPRALRVCYETRPEGASVRWTRDQDNRECVYTAGSPINNRALFPCQEPSVAMSTWQARVRAPSNCVVLMSGENQAQPTVDHNTGISTWDYYVTMPMPASTFTLAVGHWQQASVGGSYATENGVQGRTEHGCEEGAEVRDSTAQASSTDPASRSAAALHDAGLEAREPNAVNHQNVPCRHGDYPCRFRNQRAWAQEVVPHRLFAPACLLQKAQAGVLPLLPVCLAAAHSVLGVHPFPRLDLLIVPAGFSSLGMASPHVVFLSQSALCAGQGPAAQSLCGSRLCHELAHAWFGLAIGARDWTEEWISEGFATYLEDVLWARARQLSSVESEEQGTLKALLRWRRLSDEVHNSQEELQILRPNLECTGQSSESGSSTVKHALNPEKTFMQVHYLKGYFLLRFLASQVGEQRFLDFFRLFVRKYHGQLILSQDFLRLLLASFPYMESQGLTLDAISAEWLDRPGLPEWLSEGSAVWSQTRLVEEVKAEIIKWIPSSQTHGKGRKRKRAGPKVNYKELTPDQLVLLLELLLEEAELSVPSLQTIKRTYNLPNQDAEVGHRWCELVVKHKHRPAYGDLEDFLLHHQAMGVYLYGELMVQEDSEQQALAQRCLSLVQDEMDQSARRVVEEMVL